jgi:hypothetical protein
MKKDFGKSIRKFISGNFKILNILDFADIQVFHTVTNYTGIFIFKKILTNENTILNYSFFYYKFKNCPSPLSINDFTKSLFLPTSDEIKQCINIDSIQLSENVWNFQDNQINRFLDKMYNNSKKLGDIVVCIFQGIASGKDEVFYVDNSTIEKYNIEKSLLKKLLKGKDIKQYHFSWSANYVVYPYKNDSSVIEEKELKNKYPNCYRYFSDCKELLKGRGYFDKSTKKWYELWNQRNVKYFDTDRIVCPEISNKNNFIITNEYYGNTKTYHTIPINKNKDNYYYLLGLLNSTLLDFIYKKICTPQAGGFYAYKTQFLVELPIKENIDKNIVNLVIRILNLDKGSSDIKLLLNEIDQLVYKLYNLTAEEIAIVEGKNG